MLKVLLLLAVLAVVAALVVRSRGSRSRSTGGPVDPVAGRDARADKLAAEQAVIARQGGQGAGQGGVGGGMGSF